MGFDGLVELNKGCETAFCYGPKGYFITIFETESRLLVPHLLIALMIGIIFFGLFYYLDKTKRVDILFYKIIALSIIIAILNFFLFAYFYPRHVVY